MKVTSLIKSFTINASYNYFNGASFGILYTILPFLKVQFPNPNNLELKIKEYLVNYQFNSYLPSIYIAILIHLIKENYSFEEIQKINTLVNFNSFYLSFSIFNLFLLSTLTYITIYLTNFNPYSFIIFILVYLLIYYLINAILFKWVLQNNYKIINILTQTKFNHFYQFTAALSISIFIIYFLQIKINYHLIGGLTATSTTVIENNQLVDTIVNHHKMISIDSLLNNLFPYFIIVLILSCNLILIKKFKFKFFHLLILNLILAFILASFNIFYLSFLGAIL